MSKSKYHPGYMQGDITLNRKLASGRWWAGCKCGNEFPISMPSLSAGKTSCGSCEKPGPKRPQVDPDLYYKVPGYVINQLILMSPRYALRDVCGGLIGKSEEIPLEEE